MKAAAAQPHGRPAGTRPWRRALAWLAGLGIFFYASYGLANWLAAQRDQVPSVVFAWEHRIPFIAWTIVPYWSLNIFYALSMFVCANRRELDIHALRLVTAQIVAVFFFIATPLAFTFTPPDSTGIPGFLFSALNSFDRPYNQAPSLHIALLIIVWARYSGHARNRLRWLLHAWFALVGVSVLTTYQHHFIDIPTGALLGLLCLWLWPQAHATPLAVAARTRDPVRRRVGWIYLVSAATLSVLAVTLGGWGLWLCYPAVSLALIGCSYLWLGASGLQKNDCGRMRFPTRMLLAPYLAGAWLNFRLWTRGQTHAAEVTDDVWLGRFPDQRALAALDVRTVVDLTAELPAPATRVAWYCLPLLDLAAAEPRELARAADLIEQARTRGRVLVVCALGYTRSAAAIAVWLVASGRAVNIDSAIQRLVLVRPQVRLAGRRESLERAARRCTLTACP